MKHSVTLVGLVISAAAFAQEANLNAQATENATVDRKALLKTTLSFNGTSEETLFWSLYQQYEQKMPQTISCTLLNNDPSSGASKSTRQCIETTLENQDSEISVKKEFFDKINSATNGKVAMRFIQSEVLTDLMLKSRFFEATSLQRPVWNKNLIGNENEKLSLIATTLQMKKDEVVKLESILSDYEFEYSRVVGHALVWFEQYVEDLADLTPAQCSAMGTEFLKMQANEIKFKRRFFDKVADVLGEDFAARFLSLQDYFFTMDKLNVWSESVYAAR